MGVKTYRPTSPGRRGATVNDYAELSNSSEDIRSLRKGMTRTSGRNNNGRVTVRFRGGGHKRRYRQIDFKRDKFSVPATVKAIRYDPCRTAHVAVLHYADGEKRFIVAPAKLKVGDQIVSSKKADIKPGNSLPLRHIPQGAVIHNVELKIGGGAQLVRSAGVGAQLLAKEGNWAMLRMPSGEMRRVHIDCRASVGQVGNASNNNISWGKAGASRWRGRRPHVRGVVMNPVDHPMGGGEGRTSGGRHPCSPWGQKSKGLRTRSNKRTDNMIVRRRKKRK